MSAEHQRGYGRRAQPLTDAVRISHADPDERGAPLVDGIMQNGQPDPYTDLRRQNRERVARQQAMGTTSLQYSETSYARKVRYERERRRREREDQKHEAAHLVQDPLGG